VKKRRINEKSSSFGSDGWGGLCLRGGGGALGRTWRGLRVRELDPVAGWNDDEAGRERLDLKRRPDPLQDPQLLAGDDPAKINIPTDMLGKQEINLIFSSQRMDDTDSY